MILLSAILQILLTIHVFYTISTKIALFFHIITLLSTNDLYLSTNTLRHHKSLLPRRCFNISQPPTMPKQRGNATTARRNAIFSRPHNLLCVNTFGFAVFSVAFGNGGKTRFFAPKQALFALPTGPVGHRKKHSLAVKEALPEACNVFFHRFSCTEKPENGAASRR